MKRFLMLGAFVSGLLAAGMLHDTQVLGQGPDEKAERKSGVLQNDSPSVESATPAVPTELTLEPARLPKNEALEQQQAIQDIMELRQRFGSVVGDQENQFSQVIQHLVEDKDARPQPAPGLLPASEPKPHPVIVQQPVNGLPGQPVPPSRVPPSLGPPSLANNSSFSGIPQPHHPQPHHPQLNGQQLNGPQPTVPQSTGLRWEPVQTGSFALAGHPPRYPGRPGSSDSSRVQRLRNVARQLDMSANELEELGAYEAADQIREKAQALRESCRH